MVRERKRVRLTDDYSDSGQGYEYEKGQTGVSYGEPFFLDHGGGRRSTQSYVVVHFDGYEEQKLADAEARKKDGEGPNVVPYLAEIPIAILQIITGE